MSVAFVFPGQGSQVVGMGRDLYQQLPTARALFEQADDVLAFPLSQLSFEGPEEQLTATENAQPALLLVSIALLQAYREFAGSQQIVPQAVAGHSLGEYSALVAGAALDVQTALRLVRRRGELMAAARHGTMAAVIGLDETALEAICNRVCDELMHDDAELGTVVIANYNAPGQLVISGGPRAIERAAALASEQGARKVIPLKVSAAFHSPLMIDAAEGMAREIAEVPVSPLAIPLIANVTAQPLIADEDIQREMVAQIVAPVRWIASVERMVADGVTTFVEFGPGKVLTGLIKRIAPQARLVSVSSVEDARAFAAESS
jgi:[acyl-carrier-protein] S-malonyltransferase